MDPDPYWIRIHELPNPHMQIKDKMEAKEVIFRILFTVTIQRLKMSLGDSLFL